MEDKLILPLKLPQFVLICGGQNIAPFLTGLQSRAPEHCIVNLRGWAAFPPWDVTADPDMELSPIDHILEKEYGPNYFIDTFISGFKRGYLGEETAFIFPDAYPFEALPLIGNFGGDSTLTLITGELKQEKRAGKLVWLPLPGVDARLHALEREIGTL